jgi:hypothetical protein
LRNTLKGVGTDIKYFASAVVDTVPNTTSGVIANIGDYV